MRRHAGLVPDGSAVALRIAGRACVNSFTYPNRSNKKGHPSGCPFLFGGEGGIARLSRCFRESLVPHWHEGPPCGRPARAAGGYGHAIALNVRKLTLANAETSHYAACCQTRVGSSTHPLHQIKKDTLRMSFFIWRRGWDSNPR
jgi:hypothetical protein